MLLSVLFFNTNNWFATNVISSTIAINNLLLLRLTDQFEVYTFHVKWTMTAN